jgi:hypothetical protein
LSITNTLRKAGPFTCNGVTVSFPFSFKLFQASEIVVSLTDASGNLSTLSLVTNYTVTLNGNQDINPGGTVTTLLVYVAGFTITLTSGVLATQSVVLTNTGGFYPDVLNNEFDRLTILVQQLAELETRQITVPVSDPIIQPLPSVATRAGKFLTFDASGNPAAASGSGADAGLRTDLASASGAALVGTSNGVSLQGNLNSFISFSSPVAISGATSLAAGQLNSLVVATATGGDYPVTLPPVTIANLGAQMLLSVSNDSVNLVSVTAFPASGLTVGGQSIQYFAPGETVLFVYEGATAGWVMPFVRRVPIVCEMISSGGALALSASVFTYLPLVKGAQQMNAPYVGWFLTDHFVAPRDGVYTISADIWISGLTGAPGQIDFGFYINVAPNPLTGNPASTAFARMPLVNNIYQSISRTFTRRLARLQYIVPTFQLQGPSAGAIADTGVVTSRVTITENLVE